MNTPTDGDKFYVTRRTDYTSGTMLPSDTARMVPDELINEGLSVVEWIAYVVGGSTATLMIITMIVWALEH